MATRKEIIEVGDLEVTITNPDRVVFPRGGHTKLDLVRYYLAVAEGALRGVADRPMALKRYVNGVDREAFFQKRAPESRPEWIDTVELKYPSGRSAHEIVAHDAAALAWVVNLGCIDLHPHPVRSSDLAHPDELRVDLDPGPGVPWSDVRDVALIARDVLADVGLHGWPKTSGSRGFHVYCRIHPQWTFTLVRRAAVGLAAEVERRAPDLATANWWKEERHGVFVDYNQNAKDRTTASAYSIRPTADARVSTPLHWDEVPGCDPADFTMDTVPDRYASVGDPWHDMDDTAGSLTELLKLAAEHPNQPAPRSGTVPAPAPGKSSGPTGRRRTTMPLIEVARAEGREAALAGLDRWRERHADVWPYLAPSDVMVDAMRGRSSAWYRIRINLRNVPEPKRPAQEQLEVDYDPWQGMVDPRRAMREESRRDESRGEAESPTTDQ